jgi:hypothetical protein
MKRIKARDDGKGKGQWRIGIAQAGMAADGPELAPMRRQTWVQTSAAEGFYEMWSGTIGDLRRQAAAAERAGKAARDPNAASLPAPLQRCPRGRGAVSGAAVAPNQCRTLA